MPIYGNYIRSKSAQSLPVEDTKLVDLVNPTTGEVRTITWAQLKAEVGGGLSKPTVTLTANGTVTVTAGEIVIGFLVNCISAQSAFKIGNTPGADDVVSTQSLAADGSWHSFAFLFRATGTKTFYVQGITGSGVQIQIIKA